MILGAAAAMLAGAMLTTSCGKGDSEAAANDSLASVATSDSACTAFGMMAGGQLAMIVNQQAMYNGKKLDKDEFYKGLHSVIAGKHDDSYMAGVEWGTRVAGMIQQMEAFGIRVDRDRIMKTLRSQFFADSIPSEMEVQRYSEAFGRIMQERQEVKAAADMKAREAENKAMVKQAEENEKAGEAELAKLKKENPDFKVTDSGMGYVIAIPGSAQKPTADQTVTVNYKGSLLNGKVFDQNDGAQFPLAGVVPGFREALTMLGVGGEGTFYIPGKLAYGPQGQPAAGIGPNEMLVFNIKLVSIDDK